MNCFNCEMERACNTCSKLISQKKTYSTDMKMLKTKPPKECHQMLIWYVGIYEPRRFVIDFKTGKQNLMKKMVKCL